MAVENPPPTPPVILSKPVPEPQIAPAGGRPAVGAERAIWVKLGFVDPTAPSAPH